MFRKVADTPTRNVSTRRNDSVTADVYAFDTGTAGTGRTWGLRDVQHRSTRSNDFEAVAFVVALFGLLLALTVVLGAPIG
jgi:hypothetical protein